MNTTKDVPGMLVFQMNAVGLPAPVREFRFYPPRRWRFDLAFPVEHIAIECEGGIWANSRHVRGTGYENDCRKYNMAAYLGWQVYRYSTGMIESGEALADLEKILHEHIPST